ncbi:MAG: SCP2 sterol-binding domain-containing protein, partial [Acidobacteriota bacterium]
CRAARAATAEDLDAADFALRASAETWRRVLDGALEPILGLMSGKLKLRTGSLAALTPYMQASRELVAAAARVDSTFPDHL